MSHLPDISRLFSAPVGVAYHIVAALAAWFGPLPGGMATAAAIIVCTVAVRIALLPLSYYAVRGEAARALLLPKVADLQRRYRHHPDRLQREMTALWQAEGTAFFAGCLPLMLQLPFFSVMYRLFLSGKVAGVRNTLLSHRLFGAGLGSHWLTGAGPFSQQGAVFAGLLVLLAVVGWFAARFPVRGMARQAAGGAAAGAAPGPAAPGDGAPGGGAVGLLNRLAPYATLAVAAVVPLAAGIYLLTTTTWTVLERAVLRRRLLPAAQHRPQPPDR